MTGRSLSFFISLLLGALGTALPSDAAFSATGAAIAAPTATRFRKRAAIDRTEFLAPGCVTLARHWSGAGKLISNISGNALNIGLSGEQKFLPIWHYELAPAVW
jgi:hypothetical protein